jgi:hypothetical protein
MKLKTLVRQTTAIAIAWAALCLPPMAQAGTLIGINYKFPPPQQFGLATGGTSNGSPNAGAFIGTFDAVPITFFCAELTQTFSFGVSYNYSMGILGGTTGTQLGQLFTEAYGLITDSQTSAAFQLAVWEILFDTDLNLSNPSGFHVTSGNGTTVGIAQGWLNNLGADTYDIFLLQNGQHQDFVTGVPVPPFQVPEPAPLMLLGGALLAMFLVRRRV